MNIIRDEINIALTQEEMREVFLEMDHQYMMEDAKDAFAQIFEDSAHFKKTFGFPASLAVDENSPYCILQEAVERFAEQQDSHIADMDTWAKVFDDIISDIRNRWDTGRIPFSGTTVTLSDDVPLENLRILKNDDYQVEYEMGKINFEMDTASIDVDKAFGFFCNTDTNDDYVNVYVDWYPNRVPTMTVCYQADSDVRELPVMLTSKQQKVLQNLIPHLCLMALNRRPEGIWAEAQEEENEPFDEKAKHFDELIYKIVSLGYHIVSASEEQIKFHSMPNKVGWKKDFTVYTKTKCVSESIQTTTENEQCLTTDMWNEEAARELCQVLANWDNEKECVFKEIPRAVTLQRTRFLENSDDVEEESIVLDGKWLEDNLATNDIALDEFLKTYTSDSVDGILGEAIMEGGLLFIYRPNSDEPFECMDDMKWKFHAFADMISQALNDNHFEDASKYLDAFLNL